MANKVTAKGRRAKTTWHYVGFDEWLESKVNEYLANNSTERGALTRSALVRKCLVRFFKEEDSYWPLVFLRIDKLSAGVRSYEKRMHLLTNVFMHFLAYYFLNWPDLSPEEKHESSAKSGAMLAKFEESLKRKLLKGGYLEGIELDDIRDILVEDTQQIMKEISSGDLTPPSHQGTARTRGR